jgi:general L-amino acid transport system permease protein
MTVNTQAMPTQRAPRRDSLLNNPTVRSAAIQVILIAALVAFGWWIVDNTATNLRNANIASGFGFLNDRAGFDIAQLPIDYSSNATYGRAILVGVVNTIIVSVSGIVMATIVGFLVGIGRL